MFIGSIIPQLPTTSGKWHKGLIMNPFIEMRLCTGWPKSLSLPKGHAYCSASDHLIFKVFQECVDHVPFELFS